MVLKLRQHRNKRYHDNTRAKQKTFELELRIEDLFYLRIGANSWPLSIEMV